MKIRADIYNDATGPYNGRLCFLTSPYRPVLTVMTVELTWFYVETVFRELPTRNLTRLLSIFTCLGHDNPVRVVKM